MSSLTHSAVLLLACFANAAQVPADKPDQKPRIKVEFRRAETAPAEGLTEAKEVGTNKKVYLHKETNLTNEDIAEARRGKDGAGKSVLEITFTKEGAKKMEKLSKQQMNKPMAILVDGKLVMAPTIKAELSSDRAIIDGQFTDKEIDTLVKRIKGR